MCLAAGFSCLLEHLATLRVLGLFGIEIHLFFRILALPNQMPQVLQFHVVKVHIQTPFLSMFA